MLKKFLPKNKFFRGFIIVAGSTASSQALLVIVVPLLTRLYTPEQFGVLSVYSAIIGILSINAALRYEMAIPLAKSQSEMNAILRLCMLITITFSVLLIVFGLAGGAEILHFVGSSTLVYYWWLIPLGVLGAGFYQTLMQWGVRERAYTTIAKTKFIQVLSQISIQGFVGVLTGGTIGLLVGQFAGVSAGSMQFIKSALKTDHDIFKTIPMGTLTMIANEYRRFPIYLAPSGLLNTGARLSPQLLIAALYGASAAGVFFIAVRVVGAPITLVGSSLSSVYYGEATALHRKGLSIKKIFESVVIRLFITGLFPSILIYIFVEDVFPVIFGEEWLAGGNIVSILTPLMLVRFIVSPVAQTLHIAQRQNVYLIGQVILFLFSIGSILGGQALGLEFSETIVLYSLANTIGYIIFLVMTYQVVLSMNEKDISNAE